MVEVFNRIDVNYSLKDFDSDKKEKEAVKAAKREAVKTRYSFNEITEIGSGSGERTTIYKTDNEAIKVICCQTKKCFGENLEEEKKKLAKELEKLTGEIKRCEGMLNNPNFVNKAPEAKVNAEKDKLAGYQQQYRIVEERLADLNK